MPKSRARRTSSPKEPIEPGTHAQDLELFRAAVRDVKPLEASAPVPTRRPTRACAAVRAAHSPDPLDASAALGEIDASDGVPTGADVLSFRRPGVRDQTMRQLRRGLFPVEDELDLHGLNQAAARDHLADFLGYHRSAGHRCVRIVHGKGYRSGARGPILKIAVNTWLKRHADVMAFTSARAIDGGTGAVYVLLRA
jgi:DNA-nicking Smr family endonuclease